jgi:hypothetical protein
MGLAPIGTLDFVMGIVFPSRVRYRLYFAATWYSVVPHFPCLQLIEVFQIASA